MTRDEILELAREVLAGKSRSYVSDAKIFATYLLTLPPEKTVDEDSLGSEAREAAQPNAGKT